MFLSPRGEMEKEKNKLSYLLASARNKPHVVEKKHGMKVVWSRITRRFSLGNHFFRLLIFIEEKQTIGNADYLSPDHSADDRFINLPLQTVG